MNIPGSKWIVEYISDVGALPQQIVSNRQSNHLQGIETFMVFTCNSQYDAEWLRDLLNKFDK